MTLHRIDTGAVAPQPWRNGGGQTRELWRWPPQDPWQLRISRADIAHDGPFSAFAQVQRWFAVLSGAGVELQFGAVRHTLRPGGDALCFDGALAPQCRLLGGATLDLNLMARTGSGCIVRADPGQGWTSPHAMRGLYTTTAGRWQAQGQPPMALAAHCLLWDDAARPDAWHFDPQDPQDRRPIAGAGERAVAYWLGYTPQA